jgi:cation diffusion facilitator CzcD-associated flavoprotein CzcO
MSYDYLDRHDLRPALRATSGLVQDSRRIRRLQPVGSASSGFDTDAVVIGAGPYGLSISAHLSARGVSHEIFGAAMDTWRGHMPIGMYLKSEAFASSLSSPDGEHTLKRFCAETGREYADMAVPVSMESFLDYGDWFRDHLVPGLRRGRVDLVRQIPGGFELTLITGETLRTQQVVVATGMQGCAYLPPELRGLPPSAVLHSWDLHDPTRWGGVDMAVIGAGQSALEAAVLLHEHGANVRLLARAEKLSWNPDPVVGARPLKARLRHPRSGLGDGMSLHL